MQLKPAIGSFFFEFSKFEMSSVGAALRSLSKDAVFVEQAGKLLDLESRLTLLERMAFARGIPAPLMAELSALLLRARKLRVQREEIARNLAAADSDGIKPNLGAVPRKSRPLKTREADFARLAEIKDLLMPGVEQIQAYAAEAVAIQEMLHAIAGKFDRHLAGEDKGPTPRS